jgi:hypothetical protein
VNKKILLVVASLLLSLPMFAQDGDEAQILSSPHDLTTQANLTQTGTGSAQVCAYCHIPHAVQGSGPANTPAGLPLLWNHTLPASTTYTPYASAMLKTGALSNNFGTANAFYSLACLSCHDGSVAIGSVYRMPDNDTLNGTVTMADVSSGDGAMHLVGLAGDLSQTHPVNFTYDAALVTADSGIWDVGTAANVRQIGSSTLTAVRPGTTAVNGALLQPILFNGTVQCATCHNPHSEANLDFLRVPVGSTNAQAGGVPSLLCLKCHSTNALYN